MVKRVKKIPCVCQKGLSLREVLINIVGMGDFFRIGFRERLIIGSDRLLRMMAMLRCIV